MDDASTGVDDADGLLFAPGTTALAPIPKQYSEYMSFAAEIVVRASKVLGGRVLKICNRSSEEQAFCNSLAADLSLASLEKPNLPNVTVQCVEGQDIDDCANMLFRRTADLATGIDGGEIYDYSNKYNLHPVLVETIPEAQSNSSEYSAVAVVNAAFCEPETAGFRDLLGRDACGTGYGRTAGFLMPTATILTMGLANVTNHQVDVVNDAETFDAFFG